MCTAPQALAQCAHTHPAASNYRCITHTSQDTRQPLMQSKNRACHGCVVMCRARYGSPFRSRGSPQGFCSRRALCHPSCRSVVYVSRP